MQTFSLTISPVTLNHGLTDYLGLKRHVNPCGSFCVVSREKEKRVEEMNERDRG